MRTKSQPKTGEMSLAVSCEEHQAKDRCSLKASVLCKLYKYTFTISVQPLILIHDIQNMGMENTDMAIKRITVKDQVYDAIKGKIMKGEFGLGEPINMLRLSEELGTSNTPIRESLSKLEIEGLVVSNTNMKYRVIDLSDKELTDLNNALLIQIMGGYKLCRNEGKTEKLVSLLREAFKNQEALYNTPDSNDYIAASVNFDRSFVVASENAMLMKTFDTLIAPLTLSTIYDQTTHRDQNIDEHRNILAAIEKGDHDSAKTLLRNHYDRHLHE